MGNQQSISSNNLNDNNIHEQINNYNQIHIPNLNQKDTKMINLNQIKYEANSSVLGDKSEMSSSDIMMKETNESIKSIDDVNMKMDIFNNLNNQKEINAKNAHGNSSNPNQNNNIFIRIVWNEGGDNVFISGNFVNWSQWFYMNKKDQHFEIVFVILLLFNFLTLLFF